MKGNNPLARFIDCHYNDLFYLPAGEKLHISFLDGREMPVSFFALDEYHVRVGGFTYHICEFAEHCRNIGAVIRPEHPQEGNVFDYYEIYQIGRETDAQYLFCDYEYAKPYVKATDYHRVYAGMLAKETDLEKLYILHNRDDRPLAQRIRSLSMSDIVVTHRDDESKAYYVDRVGFREVPDLAEKLKKQRNEKTHKFVREER